MYTETQEIFRLAAVTFIFCAKLTIYSDMHNFPLIIIYHRPHISQSLTMPAGCA